MAIFNKLSIHHITTFCYLLHSELSSAAIFDMSTGLDKSVAGMQHTPPQNIFNAKKIILKQDLFMQSLKKIGKEMPKIEREKPIYNVNQGP